MAEASPIQRREHRGGRRRTPAEHIGDRCTMCRRKVTVDAQGRCPLGHQVVAPEVVEDRAAARGEARETTLRDGARDSGTGARPDRDAEARDSSARVVATYVEPGQASDARRHASWSTSGPAVEPAVAPRTIDLTTPPDRAPDGAPDPDLPRRPSTAPVTPPHGMTAMLPVMPAPDATAELIQVPTEPEPDATQPETTAEVVADTEPGPSAEVVAEAPPHGPASPSTVFEDPPPPLPLRDATGHDVADEPAASAQSLPQRTRTPMAPQARSLFTEALGRGDDEHLTPPEAAQVHDVAAFARIVRPAPEEGPAHEEWPAHEEAPAAEQAVPGQHASVPLSDLTPSAPSALDVDDAPWSMSSAVSSAPPPAATFEAEPMADPELEPPRGILQMVAGALFVIVLVAIAWYLATAL